MTDNVVLSVNNLSCLIDGREILQNVSLDLPSRQVSAVFGDSGSGKTTFLKILSLLFREEAGFRVQGEIFLNSQLGRQEILSLKQDLWQIRRRIVYLAQTPNPLQQSIYKNVAFPLKLNGVKDKHLIAAQVTAALQDVNLYDEVKDRLHSSAYELSGGQKQKLCIARALVLAPDIILMDEPTSSLDQRNRTVIEELIVELGKKYVILIVSHDKEQIRKTASSFFECRNKTIIQVDSL